MIRLSIKMEICRNWFLDLLSSVAKIADQSKTIVIICVKTCPPVELKP
jgi:hypothetical protein